MKNHLTSKRKTCDTTESDLASLAGLARAQGRARANTSGDGNLLFEKCITKKELALHFQVSQGLINKLMAEEGLPHLKIGRAVRFRLNDVYAWFERKGNKL